VSDTHVLVVLETNLRAQGEYGSGSGGQSHRCDRPHATESTLLPRRSSVGDDARAFEEPALDQIELHARHVALLEDAESLDGTIVLGPRLEIGAKVLVQALAMT